METIETSDHKSTREKKRRGRPSNSRSEKENINTEKNSSNNVIETCDTATTDCLKSAKIVTINISLDLTGVKRKTVKELRNVTVSPYTLSTLPYDNKSLPTVRFPTLYSVPSHLLHEFTCMFPSSDRRHIGAVDVIGNSDTIGNSDFIGEADTIGTNSIPSLQSEKHKEPILLMSLRDEIAKGITRCIGDEEDNEKQNSVADCQHTCANHLKSDSNFVTSGNKRSSCRTESGSKAKIPLMPLWHINGRAMGFLPWLIASHWKYVYYLDDFVKILLHKYDVTLSIIDWLCTGYGQQFEVRYKLRPSDPIDFVVHESYSQCLQAYQRTFFDVFARNHRILLEWETADSELFDSFMQAKQTLSQTLDVLWDTKKIVGMRSIGDKKMMYLITSVAQLNFFAWAYQHKVVEYSILHAKEIETHQKETDIKEQAEAKRQAEEESQHPVTCSDTGTTYNASFGTKRRKFANLHNGGFRMCNVETIVAFENNIHSMILKEDAHRLETSSVVKSPVETIGKVVV